MDQQTAADTFTVSDDGARRLLADVSFSITLVGTALFLRQRQQSLLQQQDQQKRHQQQKQQQQRQHNLRRSWMGRLRRMLMSLVQASMDFVFQDLQRVEQDSTDDEDDDFDNVREQWEAKDQWKARMPSDDDSLPKPAIIVARNAVQKALVQSAHQLQQHRPHLLAKSRELTRHLRHRRQLRDSSVVPSFSSVSSPKSVHFDLKDTEVYCYDSLSSSLMENLPTLTSSDSSDSDCDSSSSSEEYSAESGDSGTGSILKKRLRYSRRRREPIH